MIYVTCVDRSLLQQLTRFARRSTTPAAQHVRGVASLQELFNAAAGDAEPCVLAAPETGDDPHAWLREIRQQLNEPKVVFLLPQDDPGLSLALLQEGAFDLLCRLPYSLSHLLNTIAHAANGAHSPPYGAVFPDTHEFNPCPGSPWAIVFREGVTARTDRLDGAALRLLPRALRLGLGVILFQEVWTPALADLLEMPSLVLALLSAEPPSDDHRGRFLAAMRSLQEDGHRVLYLMRAGITLSSDLLPARARPVRHYSAIELLLRLHFGFGG